MNESTTKNISKGKETPENYGVIVGLIVSDKMSNTRVIEVNNKKTHKKYHKTYTVTKKYFAHDENNEYHTGDRVKFVSSKPYSKLKKFRIIGKI